MRGRTIAWVVLGVALVAVLGVLLFGGGRESDAERAQRLGREIACPVCVGESVAASNASESRAIRTLIQERIAQGATDAEIKDEIVRAYPGTDLAPGRGGLGVVVWGLPLLVVLLGGGGIYLALRRWSDTPRLAATDADERLVARLREEPRP